MLLQSLTLVPSEVMESNQMHLPNPQASLMLEYKSHEPDVSFNCSIKTSPISQEIVHKCISITLCTVIGYIKYMMLVISSFRNVYRMHFHSEISAKTAYSIVDYFLFLF